MDKIRRIITGGVLIGFYMTSITPIHAAELPTEKKVCPLQAKTKIKYVYRNVYVQPRSRIRRAEFYRYRRPYAAYPYAYPVAAHPYGHTLGYPSLHSVAIHHSNHPYGFQAGAYHPYAAHPYNSYQYGSYPSSLYHPAYLSQPYVPSLYSPPSQPFNIYNQF